jgi:hypothetical protein
VLTAKSASDLIVSSMHSIGLCTDQLLSCSYSLALVNHMVPLIPCCNVL